MKIFHSFIFVCAIIIGVVGCASENDFNTGKEQLENMGYTEVTNTGVNSFCCSDSDDFSTGFTAKGKNGNIVKGCFCSAFGKGVTIRFQ